MFQLFPFSKYFCVIVWTGRAVAVYFSFFRLNGLFNQKQDDINENVQVLANQSENLGRFTFSKFKMFFFPRFPHQHVWLCFSCQSRVSMHDPLLPTQKGHTIFLLEHFFFFYFFQKSACRFRFLWVLFLYFPSGLLFFFPPFSQSRSLCVSRKRLARVTIVTWLPIDPRGAASLAFCPHEELHCLSVHGRNFRACFFFLFLFPAVPFFLSGSYTKLTHQIHTQPV